MLERPDQQGPQGQRVLLDQLVLKELRENLADSAMSLTQERLELELVLVFCV